MLMAPRKLSRFGRRRKRAQSEHWNATPRSAEAMALAARVAKQSDSYRARSCGSVRYQARPD